jgi:hypothetical protein
MTSPWELVDLWPVRVAVLGGLVLLAGRLLLMLTRQPARRALVGTAAVAAALLVIPLSWLPGWLPVSVVSPAPAVAERAEPPALTRPVAPDSEGEPEYIFVLTPDADPATAVAERPALQEPETSADR